ncbi:nucleoside hydrolase [Pseudonocardia sp. KRD291]|uniref:nucleoside hydrolase n=1 Tax=Pseudonocardia sp. KRD291 TaxID=2792007 RepID=UPI001C4A70CC|nr:nucleoside hydrolase [Pseudonocardia sp. KRD291]MBW0101509.1 nucleoside hydrolase [Pseudonocardia sp. KRD291]
MTTGPERDLSVSGVREHWQTMVELGEALPGTDLATAADGLRTASWPADTRAAPIVIDTDIGGDPDDALALVAAARHQPDLTLVLTADETGGTRSGAGQRARFARLLLDSVGRPDVATVAGASAGGTDYFCVEGLTPAGVAAQPSGPAAVLDAVREVCRKTDGPIRWVGMAPVGNLAHIVEHVPELAARLQVTQMGGALNYRHPDRAEHNIRLDVDAAHHVLAAVADGRLARPRLVTSDVTFTPQIGVDADHPIHRTLAAAEEDSDGWASILAAHLDRWYASNYPSTLQHDALTLSAALGLPFVRSAATTVVLDEIGRMSSDPAGAPVRLSASADYPAFMTWLGTALDPATPAGAALPAHVARRPA